MDVELILEKLSQLGLLRLSRKSGDYYQVYCPIHNDGNEKKPSCGILLHEQIKNGVTYPQGFCHCFACSYSNSLEGMITDILKAKNISVTGRDWLVKNVPGFEPDQDFEHLISSDMYSQLESKYATNYILSKSENNENYVEESELKNYRYTVPYLYERKLTDNIIEKYDVGVDMNWVPPGRSKKVPAVTFPVRDSNGRTLFLCRRSISGKLYNYPSGVTKPVYGIYELPKNCKSVIVCESCFNALTAEVYGYDAVALLGTGNSYQIDQLKQLGVSDFVLCMDGDDAGQRATLKLKRALSSCAMIWTIHMPKGKDLNDCSKSEFDDLYSRRD